MSSFVLASRLAVSSQPALVVARTGAVLVAGSALITLAAKISVPVWPVPVTLQTLAVAFLSASVGRKLALGIVLTYLAQGMLGLPVFASGGGVAYFTGPTAGFLLAYLPMAYIIGWAADHGASKRPLFMLATMLMADAFLMAIGFAWLLSVAGAASWIDSSNPVVSAWRGAVEPFIVWDALKMSLAALLSWVVSSASRLVQDYGYLRPKRPR